MLERISSLDRGNIPRLSSRSGQRQRFLRVVGSHSTIVDAFLAAISSLDPGDELIAVTTPTIWRDDNLGPSSRISSMLQLLRLKGVSMKWLMLISTNDLFKPPTQRVLGFRCADDHKLEELQQLARGRDTNGAAMSGQGFFYACLTPSEYEQVLREKKIFIGFRKAQSREGIVRKKMGKENPLYLQIALRFELPSRDVGSFDFLDVSEAK